MTTNTDILKPNCCCIRHDSTQPELMLLENLVILFVFISVHFGSFLLGWKYISIGTLLGVYYALYEVMGVYYTVNKCYLNRLREDDSDHVDDDSDHVDADAVEDEDDTEEGAKDDAEEGDEEGAQDDAEDGEVEEGEVEEGEVEDGEVEEGAEEGAEEDEDDMPPLISLNDYADMPPLVAYDDMTHLTNMDLNPTPSREDITNQIKNTLKRLQEMIEVTKGHAELIPEFKALSDHKN